MNLLKLQTNSIQKTLVKQIAREYNTLQHTPQLSKLLSLLFPDEIFLKYSKIELHKILNNILMSQYKGEQELKYKLYKQFINRNVVGAFEMKVLNSRMDFLAINGSSHSFEIKSSLDNLNKLNKQSADYIRAFEYNYIVIDFKHLAKAEQIVPLSFGIWSFKGAKKNVHRESTFSSLIDPEIQLRLLTKKEIFKGFADYGGETTNILANCSSGEINSRFKEILKVRYFDRWQFIASHKNYILPIDLQFFFNNNIHPEIIYHS